MSELTGRVLAGRYRVQAFLGRGGMADVYRAVDQRGRQPVALKVLREDLSDDPVFLRRFRREADLLSQLQHPNIVRYHGLEEGSGLVFMVVEFIDGRSLKAELARLARPLTPGQAAAVLRPVSDALDYAHGLGILHCDVKPANILIERGGRILLADFGIARWVESATTTFAGAGTPAYMSPEQCRGSNIVPQSDVYGLSVTLYEMLTLDRPFIGETGSSSSSIAERVRWEHLHASAPSPRRINPQLPPAVEAIVLAGLAKDPEERPPSAGELYRGLVRAGAAPDANFPQREPMAQPQRGVGRQSRDNREAGQPRPTARPRAVPWPLVAGLGGIVLFALALLFVGPAASSLTMRLVEGIVSTGPAADAVATRGADSGSGMPAAGALPRPVLLPSETVPATAPAAVSPAVPLAPTAEATARAGQQAVPPPAPSQAPTALPSLTPAETASPSNVYIEYVLDASNSMMEPWDDSGSKWQAARTALAEHWRTYQPAPNAGLRAFGHRRSALDEASCRDTEMLSPVAPAQPERLVGLIAGLAAEGMSALEETLRQASGDFTLTSDRANALILIVDGSDNCGVDACRLVRFQREGGIRYPIYIAALKVDTPAQETLNCIAVASDGQYRDVSSTAELLRALNDFAASVALQP